MQLVSATPVCFLTKMSSNEALARRRPELGEVIRFLILSAAAVAVMSPFLTSRSIGGVDAFWYANMVRGATDQIAAGHFPVPVGEGQSAWNGGVHPFRSAPVYPLLAVLWDLVTLGRLGEFSLQHLTALTSALAGTLGFYLAASKAIPGRRWAALAFALLYLAAPSWLGILVNVEDYMSYMAFAAMPLVLYGNARSTLGSDGRGYVPLGAGLALVWMCHPPIALLACVTTVFIQAGAAASRGFAPWKGLVACAAAFAVLSAYYFISMSELPRASQDNPMVVESLQILALALAFIGLGQSALRPRHTGWVACTLLGAVVVGVDSRPWLIWISVSAVFWIAAVAVFHRRASFDLPRHAFSVLFACSLLGAGVSEVITGPTHPDAFATALKFLVVNTQYLRGLLLPLPTPFGGLPVLQLGWGLDLALAAGALSLFGRRPLGAKLFFAASLGLFICFVRVPLVSDFLVGYFPGNLASMSGFPLGLRITPVIASFSAMAGFLWVATLPEATGRSATTLGVLAILVAWSGIQASRFDVLARGVLSTASRDDIVLRPENLALSRYAYDLMHLPDYYSNGVTDPRIESRLLDDSGRILAGPEEAARALEARGVQRIRLVCVPNPAERWFDITPAVTVGPGEHLLLRFEFDPGRIYNGYLIMTSEHGYREYHLPDSGLAMAFGIGGSRTTVLSMWNSGKSVEHYHLSVSREPGNDIDVHGGLFANLSVSKFEPDALPIRLESLSPYRATVSTATGGWLETFRLYLPGYRAWVDGRPVPVVKSAEALAEVKVPPGMHTVELLFVGTTKLALAAALSAAGWIALCLIWMRRAWLGA
jgi:hypothetical protein